MDYSNTISCRITEHDRERLDAAVDASGVSQSQYLRTILRVPRTDEDFTRAAVYLIDRKSMAKLANELVRWGRHYNQAVHAMNTIALFVRRGNPPEYAALERAVAEIETKLDKVEKGRAVIEYALCEIVNSTTVDGD